MQIIEFLKLIRVKQWIKNVFIFIPLVFSKHVLESAYSFKIAIAFVAFCCLSSVVYVINDIVDREADKLHPKKKFRPLAAGTISVPAAISAAGILLILNVIIGMTLNTSFLLTGLAYLSVNIFYSFYAKNVVLLDVFCIAGGFMLRVIAGAFAIQVEISSWLILTTMFLSLFLGIMKRRSELSVIGKGNNPATRKVLENYTVEFADQMSTISASAVIICYALYTVAQRTVTAFHTEGLIYTTPFVVFGIFRYMFLVHKYDQGENTTEIMLSDKPMIATILLYLAATVLTIYYHALA
jgi:4-hydroxybenzoate polyprenyltransferase